MDYSLQYGKSYIGKHIADLPTPAFLLSKPRVEKNVQQMLDDVAESGLSFRPHVKTLKSIEVTRMMLGNGRHRKAIASTLCEIEGMLPLVKDGVMDECLYGLPVYAGALPRLVELSKSIKIVLIVDCLQQVDLLEAFAKSQPGNGTTWEVFIKIDVGTHRAGLPLESEALHDLVRHVDTSNSTRLYGFYCHAGHSYGVTSIQQAADMLHLEVTSVMEASQLVDTSGRRFVVSVGATPTAHVIHKLKATIPNHLELELHAGNFCVNDLQQLSTGLISQDQLAIRILAEVCSVYPDRNEALINAGVIALTRETSSVCKGYGRLVEQNGWDVVKVSQEHGIIGLSNPRDVGMVQQKAKADEVFSVGQKVTIWCQHACITASNFHVYYVVNGNDTVVDTWIPWKGW